MNPPRVTVQEWSDDNMGGYSWSWEIWVSRRKDGTFSVGARQFVYEPPAQKVETRCRLKTGAQVLIAIERVIDETGYSFPKENLKTIKEVVNKLKSLDPKCAEEFRVAALA